MVQPEPDVWHVALYAGLLHPHLVEHAAGLFAFLIATGLGVPFGLFLGWSKNFREFTFPVFETLRPIPVLAWVPLAIVMFRGDETPVIFLTTLASFLCHGAQHHARRAVDRRVVLRARPPAWGRASGRSSATSIVPGALPFIFTGLQISVGVAWFSLVAAEMVSGEYGLGYLILASYVNVQYLVIIIGMISVGVVGYASSALVRLAGDYLMQWRVRELALGGAMNLRQELATKGAIRIEHVDKVYHAREGEVQAVADCSLEIAPARSA